MKRSFIMVFLMAGALGSMADTVIAAPVQVSAGQKCFRADVMATSDDRAKGLMFRDGLADDEGMRFVFDEPDEYSEKLNIVSRTLNKNFDVFLSNSFGFGGTNSSLIVKKI